MTLKLIRGTSGGRGSHCLPFIINGDRLALILRFVPEIALFVEYDDHGLGA